jgi:hypothetical protein
MIFLLGGELNTKGIIRYLLNPKYCGINCRREEEQIPQMVPQNSCRICGGAKENRCIAFVRIFEL